MHLFQHAVNHNVRACSANSSTAIKTGGRLVVRCDVQQDIGKFCQYLWPKPQLKPKKVEPSEAKQNQMKSKQTKYNNQKGSLGKPWEAYRTPTPPKKKKKKESKQTDIPQQTNNTWTIMKQKIPQKRGNKSFCFYTIDYFERANCISV